MTIYAEKLLPHDVEAEEAVLGSLLIDGQCIARLAPLLKGGDFYRERNQLCFDAAVALFQRDLAIDQLTLAGELARTEKLDLAGGMAYLSHLVAITPTSVHAEDYAQAVSRTATMRKLIDAGTRITALGYNDTADLDATIREAEDALFAVRGSGPRRGFIPLRQFYDQFLQEQASAADPWLVTGMPVMSGFPGLDEYLGGLQRADMVVLGARPSMGKSTLAINVAVNAAKNGQSCGIFSLEMTGDQIAMRILASEANVDSHRLRLSLYTAQEETRIIDAIGQLSDLPVYIDDTPYQGMVEIRGNARRLALEHGLDLLGGGLPAADTGAAPGRAVEPGAGDQRDLPGPQGAGRRPEGAPHRLLPAQPDGGEPAQPPAPAIGPARLGLHRAGRRRGDVHPPGGRLHHPGGVGADPPGAGIPQEPGGDHHRQAPEGTHREHPAGVRRQPGQVRLALNRPSNPTHNGRR